MFVIYMNNLKRRIQGLVSQSPYRVNMFVIGMSHSRATWLWLSQSPYRVNMFVIQDENQDENQDEVSIPLSGQYVCNLKFLKKLSLFFYRLNPLIGSICL